MKIVTTEDIIKNCAKRWKSQYCNGDDWMDTSNRNSKEVYEKLLSHSKLTKEIVKEIIGNDSWTWQYCDCCGKFEHSDHVNFVNNSDNCVDICPACLEKAYKLFKKAQHN